ncbi:ABC transporter ATP-binding protein [Jeotgalibaca caeni]|uniref:ABC transporter ATP-binding protein n=1 Tax=Jeotgalibaca caeni TaxID=3028623 RepID=UPI00237D484B|nr:ABC transporter ATP-binding protein [Jeotgalibaca caeni]MDE1549021.1 DUF3744 domain-containing protein [Jeotgalibaca caeni]
MKKPLITFRNFTFTYSDQIEPVLNELNVAIYEGEKILVVGPSGSGKTTFARCLTGVLPNKENNDYSGTITIGRNDEQKSTANFLPNELAITMEVSAEVINEKQRSTTIQPAVQPFQTYLEQKKSASMNWFLSRYPSLTESFEKLSDRQFEKMTAAGLLLNDDKPFLLLDEPLANLDPKSGDIAMNFINELHQKTETTIVIIEHRLEDALVYPFDRLILFSEGRIIADGKPSEILKSDVLADIGIREPLYITAMRYAGVNLDLIHRLDDVHSINGPNLKADMERWLSYLPHFQYPSNDEILLEIEDVSFKYPWNEENIVNHVSLQIMEGEMLSLIGPNGSGKTTLAKIISGQEEIQSGKMYWKGEDISDYDKEKMASLVGYIPQNPLDFISQENIYEEIAYRLRQRNFPPEEIEKKVEEAIRVCSLQYIRDLPMATLSFGQLRRVVIAAVLALSPDMIIVEEPTAGQDFMRYTEIMSFLQTIHLQGVTVLLVTHDMHLMLEYTKRAVVMAEGQVLADASPVSILVSPELIEKSSLKEASLYTFAKRIGMKDPYVFTEKFIHYDRVARLF